MKTNNTTAHTASAKVLSSAISTKHSIEISNYLRYKSVGFAKSFLEDVVALKKAVPFKKFNRDVGHKPGMASGRFPKKAAAVFLAMIKSVESNAQAKGLNTSHLKIIKILANKASIPATGGRQRYGTKRTHLEVVAAESQPKAKKSRAQAQKKAAPRAEVKSEPKAEVKETPKTEVKKAPAVEKKEEPAKVQEPKAEENKEEKAELPTSQETVSEEKTQ